MSEKRSSKSDSEDEVTPRLCKKTRAVIYSSSDEEQSHKSSSKGKLEKGGKSFIKSECEEGSSSDSDVTDMENNSGTGSSSSQSDEDHDQLETQISISKLDDKIGILFNKRKSLVKKLETISKK